MSGTRKILVDSHLRHPDFVSGKPESGNVHLYRMRHYNVTGASIAVIHDGKIDWTGVYGKISNDCDFKPCQSM